MGEDEIVRLFNAKIKLERKQYKKRVLQLAPERIYQRAYQINCRENIAETLLEKSGEMKSEVLRCLLVLPNVIQFFYARWMGKGDSFQLELENSMDTGIKEIGLAPGAGRNGGGMKKRVMCVHTELVREGSVLYEGKDGNTGITTTEEAAGFAASFFGKQDKELLYVCAVNGELEPVLMELVAKGSKNVCYAEPADIFKSAILANAYGIFCFHNHPGGRAKASKEDIDLTARLEACGVMLGIPLLDHIIISSQGEVYSIKEQDEEKLNETMSRMFDKKKQ